MVMLEGRVLLDLPEHTTSKFINYVMRRLLWVRALPFWTFGKTFPPSPQPPSISHDGLSQSQVWVKLPPFDRGKTEKQKCKGERENNRL